MESLCKINAKTQSDKNVNSISQSRKNASCRSANSPVEKIMFLQRTAGNQAVQRLIKSGVLQAKLKIGQLGDKYEQEADRVADKVMRMPEPGVQRQPIEEEEEEQIQTKPVIEQITPSVQRQIEDEEGEELQAKTASGLIPEVQPNVESHIHSIKGGGQPLSKNDRAFFEPLFGHDFSKVRVHTDSKAAESARAADAQAFTYGRDIVFGRGSYQPDTLGGRRLLAHELTHVIQQGSGSQLTNPKMIQRVQTGRPTPRASYFTYELDAERHTYGVLASYYGLERWEDIRDETPGRPEPSALRLDHVVRIPARNLPTGTVQVVGTEPALVASSSTAGVNFRWGNSSSANRIGSARRGTATNVGAEVSNYRRAWIESGNLQNRAEGVIAELQVRNRTAGNNIYGYLPTADVRLASRSAPATDVDILARMVFGEQRSQGRNAMVVAAWIVRNRYDAGWGGSYAALLTDQEFHALRTTRAQDMTSLNSTEAQSWKIAQQVAQGVINGTISDPTGGRGFYFGNGDTVRRRMEVCQRRVTGYRFVQVPETNLFWSNGNYTGGTLASPQCGEPQSR